MPASCLVLESHCKKVNRLRTQSYTKAKAAQLECLSVDNGTSTLGPDHLAVIVVGNVLTSMNFQAGLSNVFPRESASKGFWQYIV